MIGRARAEPKVANSKAQKEPSLVWGVFDQMGCPVVAINLPDGNVMGFVVFRQLTWLLFVHPPGESMGIDPVSSDLVRAKNCHVTRENGVFQGSGFSLEEKCDSDAKVRKRLY